MLTENSIETEDSFLSFGFIGLKDYVFHDIGQVYMTDKPLRNSTIVFSSEVFLDTNMKVHSRTVYGIFDLLGDIGGEI